MPDTKTDLKRLGIFKELSYTTIDDPYVPPGSTARNYQLPKGQPQMYLAGGYSKLKSANADGYFDPFTSIHIGDGGMTFADVKRQMRKDAKLKNLNTREWIPSSKGQMRSGVGSNFGSFSKVSAFDPATKTLPTSQRKRNFYTSPGKLGTGYGYADVCLNRLPSWHAGDTAAEGAYRNIQLLKADHVAKVKGRPVFISTTRTGDAFYESPWSDGDPLAPGGPVDVKFGVAAGRKSLIIGPTFYPSSYTKLDGGMKDGTITKFPEYVSEEYRDPEHPFAVKNTKLLAGEWIPPDCTSDVIPQPSVLNKNIDLHFNQKTQKHLQKVWDFC